MANLGAADQNRMMQMVNMWENGSAEERMAMEAAGIADVQPVSKMVGGQEALWVELSVEVSSGVSLEVDCPCQSFPPEARTNNIGLWKYGAT